MQINRMIETVFILLKEERVTARQLAERFEVTTRTVYRDLDALSGAGIPVVTDKGGGGGISLAEGFRLKSAILNREEQQELVSLLEGAASSRMATEALINKLAGVFREARRDYVKVDLTGWERDEQVQRIFDALKAAILSRRVVRFSYYNTSGRKSERDVEPCRLIFKTRAWYLQAWCRQKAAFRLFRLSRMRDLRETGETFEPRDPADEPPLSEPIDVVAVTLKIAFPAAYRVRDEFDDREVTEKEDGYIVRLKSPYNEWLTGYILSFGEHAEVIEPDFVREEVARRAAALHRKYL